MPETSSAILDRARTGKEVALVAALLLMQAAGDPKNALTLAGELEDVAIPETVDELDAVAIAAQAIREAWAMRGGPDA